MSEDNRLGLLIVEDNSDTNRTLAWLIRGMTNLTVASAHTLAEAVSILYDRRPRKIASDLKLPDGSGLNFVAEARAFLPDARIAVFTAYGDDQTRADALAAGADAYEVKPLTVETAMASLDIESNGGTPHV